MQEILLTIVTSTWNIVSAGRADSLTRCVKSASSLPFAVEHLIVDGGSRDGTLDLLAHLQDESRVMKFRSEPDTGIYNALNKGVKAARGRWVLILGSDDFIFDAHALERTIGAGNSRGLDIICSPVKTDSSGDLLNLNVALYNLPCCHQGLLARREFIERMGWFDERYRIASDYAFSLRAFLSAPKYAVIREVYAYYSMDGVLADWGRKIEEISKIATELLGMRECEIANFAEHYLIPFRILLPLLCHANALVRRCAWWSLLRHCLPSRAISFWRSCRLGRRI